VVVVEAAAVVRLVSSHFFSFHLFHLFYFWLAMSMPALLVSQPSD
jgi:hypothetical protein